MWLETIRNLLVCSTDLSAGSTLPRRLAKVSTSCAMSIARQPATYFRGENETIARRVIEPHRSPTISFLAKVSILFIERSAIIWRRRKYSNNFINLFDFQFHILESLQPMTAKRSRKPKLNRVREKSKNVWEHVIDFSNVCARSMRFSMAYDITLSSSRLGAIEPLH